MITKQLRIGTGFGAHSTAADVLSGIDLTGTTALVTGGYSGLGLETTRALARAGAHVIVPARRPVIAERALHDITGTEVHALDLADLESVRVFCERFLETRRPLRILINGAGVMACPETRVGPGWEAHFAINHLGHFALVHHLRSALASGGARVVSIASSGHFLSGIRWDDVHFRTGYDRWLAYAQSKTANALFALHLDTLGADRGLSAFAVHPGSILTPLQRHIPRQEWLAQGWVTPDGGKPPVSKPRSRARRQPYGRRLLLCSTATEVPTARTATSRNRLPPTTCSSAESSHGPRTPTRHPGSGNSPADSPG